MDLEIIILAAGKGSRMRTTTPKVLQHLAGKTLLAHVVQTAQRLSPKQVHVVYSDELAAQREQFTDYPINWVLQAKAQGTGDAVKCVLPHLSADARTLILYADVPLLMQQTLDDLLAEPAALTLLSAEVADPFGLGRVVRDDLDNVQRIVEHKDADDDELAIAEIFSGIMLVSNALLQQCLPDLHNDNQQGEYYLTDIIAMAVAQQQTVAAVLCEDTREIQGINTQAQLAQAECSLQERIAEQLMAQGVCLRDPGRFDVRGEIQHIGRDVVIDVGVILEGKIRIGDNVTIGPYSVLRDVDIADNVTIKAYSHIENATLGSDACVGPFARLRPGTVLQQGVHIGNFVEVKNSHLDTGSKACHLAYIGDSQVGEYANIGAGTITANYNGVKKSQTQIGAHARIGSNVTLVAPVEIGDYATIGAGSTITKYAPADTLTISRVKQKSLPDWQRPEKE